MIPKEARQFQSILAKNGQVTLRKDVRELLDIQPSDWIVLEVVRVLDERGNLKVDFEKEVKT